MIDIKYVFEGDRVIRKATTLFGWYHYKPIRGHVRNFGPLWLSHQLEWIDWVSMFLLTFTTIGLFYWSIRSTEPLRFIELVYLWTFIFFTLICVVFVFLFKNLNNRKTVYKHYLSWFNRRARCIKCYDLNISMIYASSMHDVECDCDECDTKGTSYICNSCELLVYSINCSNTLY